MKVAANRQNPAVDAFLSRSQPGLILSKYISPSQINLIFIMYTNTYSLKLKIMVGYIDLKQQGAYEKLKNRD